MWGYKVADGGVREQVDLRELQLCRRLTSLTIRGWLNPIKSCRASSSLLRAVHPKDSP